MIKIYWKPLDISDKSNSHRWQNIKKLKDDTTSRFAFALENQINEDLNVSHEVTLILSMKKNRDKFVWDFTKVPESADGLEVIRYIKTRRFADQALNFFF